jgi:hypothetical protein
VVTATIGLLVCAGLIRGRAYRLTFAMTVFLIVFAVGIEFMGVARTTLSSEFLTLPEIWDTFVRNSFGTPSIRHIGTVSSMATTFSNTVFLVDSHTVNLLYGKSFLEWIPRTPPEFMYPDRPRDYAWIFSDFRMASGGGFFELAEGYINFGLAGTFFVPLAVSFAMARAFRNALERQTAWAYFMLFSFLGMFMRGTWYQIFAFYKCFWTALVMYACYYATHVVIMRMRRQSPRTGPLLRKSVVSPHRHFTA